MRKIYLYSAGLLFLLWAGYAYASRHYWIHSTTYIFDPSVGTFVHNESTYGYIVQGSYVVKSTDTAYPDITNCEYSNTITLVNPLSAFPTVEQMRQKIETNFINKGGKVIISDCYDYHSDADDQSDEDSEVNTPGLKDSTINP
jgi:hypothetical protein